MKIIPILKEKLKLSAFEYYILENQILTALERKELTLDIIKSLISKAQFKYFSLRLQGLNFNQIANELKVNDGSVTQACKRAAIFITEYLNKLHSIDKWIKDVG